MELLQIDPARRCRSAAEVMQRLAAIAGLESLESNDVSQAYIATPVLVGREAELRRFRQRLRRTLQGEGAALCFEAAAGLGRSRLLDASVLEAKTHGATVLHVAGGAATTQAFSAAHKLSEQLLEALPELANRAALESRTDATLFTRAQAGTLQLPPLAAWNAERRVLQIEPARFIQAVGRIRAIVIAVDDVQRIDEALLALLAGLAHAAGDSPVLLVVTCWLLLARHVTFTRRVDPSVRLSTNARALGSPRPRS
jgi:hypothetical protein